MKFNTLSRRAAALGAATALASAGLVAAAGTAGAAQAVTNNYDCNAGLPFSITLLTEAPWIENYVNAGVAAGSALPGGVLSTTNQFTISDATHTFMTDTAHVDHIDVTDFTGSFGGKPVGVEGITVTMAGFTQNLDGTWTSAAEEGDGTNTAFTAPAAGAQPVKAPGALTMVATTAADSTIPVSCTVNGTPGTYETINVVKNDPTMKASSNSPVKHGKKAILKAKVTAPNHAPTGKVLFKDGKKKLGKVSLNAKGLAVLKTKLSKGTHKKVSMNYLGDGYTSKSTSAVFKVVQK